MPDPPSTPLHPLKWVLVHGAHRSGTSYMARFLGRASERLVSDWGLGKLFASLAKVASVAENRRGSFDAERILLEFSRTILNGAPPAEGDQFELVFKQAGLTLEEYETLVRMWGPPERIIYCFRSPDDYIESAIRKFPRFTLEHLQQAYATQLEKYEPVGGRCFEYHGGLKIRDYLKFLDPIHPNIERRKLELFEYKGTKNPDKVTPEMRKTFKKLKALQKKTR